MLLQGQGKEMPSLGHKYLWGTLLQGEEAPLKRYFVSSVGGYSVSYFFVVALWLCFPSVWHCIVKAAESWEHLGA